MQPKEKPRPKAVENHLQPVNPQRRQVCTEPPASPYHPSRGRHHRVEDRPGDPKGPPRRRPGSLVQFAIPFPRLKLAAEPCNGVRKQQPRQQPSALSRNRRSHVTRELLHFNGHPHTLGRVRVKAIELKQGTKRRPPPSVDRKNQHAFVSNHSNPHRYLAPAFQSCTISAITDKQRRE